jgi:acetyl-CoA acetyltransferase
MRGILRGAQTFPLVAELERRNARYGLVTMCIGFDQAIAAMIERV